MKFIIPLNFNILLQVFSIIANVNHIAVTFSVPATMMLFGNV